ncbi:hypothetical protein GIB67_006738 [Kingdonia uniflora]|uniref:Non-structural maintenance of chromosomes element 1 homolog n=1 Tax=Kingdonia uniflora TaxID=39325 RepID=A0A7J7LYR8_9MAGN|nr:hypothetical protein GIB67_006738 [Kingdonia uniflora]
MGKGSPRLNPLEVSKYPQDTQLIVSLDIFFQALTGIGSQSQGESSNIPAAFRNFSISQKEKTLDELVRDRWLCSPSDGRIGLGVRSFFDLRSWFRNNDVPSCDICNEAAVKAELCQNESCAVRIHSYCLKKKFAQRKVKRVCPGCDTQWSFPVTGSEGAEEEEGDEPNTQTQATHSSGSAMRKRRRSCKTENMDVKAPGTSPSQAVPDMRRATRRSTRLN